MASILRLCPTHSTWSWGMIWSVWRKSGDHLYIYAELLLFSIAFCMFVMFVHKFAGYLLVMNCFYFVKNTNLCSLSWQLVIFP
jgi:hypothetical protein